MLAADMYASKPHNADEVRLERRKFDRLGLQCRARIVIGSRHYVGRLDNISAGGAKLTTDSPIGGVGNVLLKLPNLEPLRCQLRWSDSFHAGVSFEPPLSTAALANWLETRSSNAFECEIVGVEAKFER